MPKKKFTNVLVIGSGPIIIGQAAEFDYSGTQACLALKEEGVRVILVNSNPATIMTDEETADAVYFEPLTAESLEKIIIKEKPDGLLATVGGQTGLNLAFQLNEKGILEKYGLQLLGTSIQSIEKGEDREKFRSLMKELQEPVPESEIVTSLQEALDFAGRIGYPLIIRPAYTLGGKGGGIAETEEEYKDTVINGLQASPIHQCLIERSIAGFKELEYEVMRDEANTCITVCNMENIDPVGVHTGDSIVVAPSQTLIDKEYQMLRSASLKIVSSLGIIGGCNIQFALDPKSDQYYVIEVNPRVSRSSALASKATGYPIAKIAAKLGLGFTLDELKNPLTETTFASFEPALDYVIVKFPRWPFDKLKGIDRKLGTKMKATGEVMAIARNMEAALLKALESLELPNAGTRLPELASCSMNELEKLSVKADDRRFFAVTELLKRGKPILEIHEETAIDLYFLNVFAKLVRMEREIESHPEHLDQREKLQQIKEKGLSDKTIAFLTGISEMEVREKRKAAGISPIFKHVDTCAAEFDARTNYFYSSYYGVNDLEQQEGQKKKVLVIGSGPIRIGQGVEFDYSAVQGIRSLQALGYEAIMINNNPETVSTDFETADRLYFEPLTLEYVLNVAEHENIEAAVVQFGGQTAINLAEELEEAGIKLLGTSSHLLDLLEDRKLFYSLLDRLDIPRMKGAAAANEEEALEYALEIGFPLLLRPSYVIGGKGMVVLDSAQTLADLLAGMEKKEFPVLLDRYFTGDEAEIDLVSDGKSIFVPAVMEHIERAGVHSGDSHAILPAQNIAEKALLKMEEYGKRIALDIGYKGLMNIQFLLSGEEVYVLEVNPRASRTVPVISKVTGISLVDMAVKILCGTSLEKIKPEPKKLNYAAVKLPVFSVHAIPDMDALLSPEMKSTGEGMFLGKSAVEAYRKMFDGGSLLEKPIFIDDELSEKDLPELADAVYYKDSFDERLQEIGLLYSPGNTASSKKNRKKAASYGVRVITEAPILKAFCQALNVKDYEVRSIQEWQKEETAIEYSGTHS
ncbi:carbamoyl phosphate synthase large subunit [Metabacillus sp. GX 13764]|uniref:carbamoyl phosphate synthase large subunit n=1 Tax=Metabacillus kandeliae TaxID=2900151 RepID=UPI001E5BC320|nr:carbamoyl phosphate synthase large subunit [Metabacillus kandeliae]MCD7034953.1 carbamoyl phosphate synthase large subunit [Metabacillus kandeliae]